MHQPVVVLLLHRFARHVDHLLHPLVQGPLRVQRAALIPPENHEGHEEQRQPRDHPATCVPHLLHIACPGLRYKFTPGKFTPERSVLSPVHCHKALQTRTEPGCLLSRGGGVGGGGGGGLGPKNNDFTRQNNDYTNIQPLEVGYANGPQKMGRVCRVSPCMCACLALI